MGQVFLVDFGQRSLVLLVQLLEAALDGIDGALGLLLLDAEVLDLLLDGVELSLLVDTNALGFVVLLLDLGQLRGHLADLLQVVLHCRGVVRGLEEGVGLDEGSGAVCELELLLEDAAVFVGWLRFAEVHYTCNGRLNLLGRLFKL